MVMVTGGRANFVTAGALRYTGEYLQACVSGLLGLHLFETSREPRYGLLV